MNQTQSVGATQVEEQAVLDHGDHERYSHYVKKNKIVESAVMGNKVVALCGKVWVPSRDPKKFPVCPTCKAIYEGFIPEPEETN
ncbi:MAG: DUF3039 domain-containing protein [Aquiluna sp.]|nr:DUF3039 domain-containing protein [Aquiluna sp.]MCF8546085.1 DUF3039 domain-containing protein [Aquiluna sp.]